jgi:hypothetical protein
MHGTPHTNHMSDPEDDHHSETGEEPLMDRMRTLAERIPFIVDVKTGIKQRYQQDGIVVSQWHRHLSYKGRSDIDN